MSLAVLLAAGGSLALVVAFAPARADRAVLLTWGLAGIVGMAAIAAAPSLDLVVLVALGIALLHAALAGRRPLAARLRVPALAVALLGLGLVFARLEGPSILARLAAVGFVAGLAAALGILPYIHEFDPDELTTASPIAGIAILGPILGLVVVMRARELIPVAAAVLAGSAPFAGFAARVFLLRGATQLYWPLALVIGLGLLLWLPPSLRLGRSLGLPRGRQAVGAGIAIALSVVIGLYPQPILSLAGL